MAGGNRRPPSLDGPLLRESSGSIACETWPFLCISWWDPLSTGLGPLLGRPTFCAFSFGRWGGTFDQETRPVLLLTRFVARGDLSSGGQWERRPCMAGRPLFRVSLRSITRETWPFLCASCRVLLSIGLGLLLGRSTCCQFPVHVVAHEVRWALQSSKSVGSMSSPLFCCKSYHCLGCLDLCLNARFCPYTYSGVECGEACPFELRAPARCLTTVGEVASNSDNGRVDPQMYLAVYACRRWLRFTPPRDFFVGA